MILQSLLNSYKRANIDYLDFGTASFDLIYRLRDYEKVLLIDGMDAGLPPGELRLFELKQIDYELKQKAISSHEFNLKGLFELCKKLKIKTRIYVAGVQVEDISYKEGLSERLQVKKEGLVKEINSFIEKKLNKTKD